MKKSRKRESAANAVKCRKEEKRSVTPVSGYPTDEGKQTVKMLTNGKYPALFPTNIPGVHRRHVLTGGQPPVFLRTLRIGMKQPRSLPAATVAAQRGLPVGLTSP
jgi:hypothetical protein